MNILISAFSFFPNSDGIANVCLHHALGFIENGHKVSIATSKNIKQISSPSRNRQFDIYEFDIFGGPNFNYKGEVRKYQHFLINSNFDIIFFHCLHSWNTDVAVRVLDKIEAKKILVSHGYSGNIIYSIKGLLHYFSWNNIKYHFQLGKMLSKFDHIVFLSSVKDKNRFYDHYLAVKKKINNFSIIPNGTDFLDLFEDKNELYGFKKNYQIKTRYMIINVASYSKLKNQMLALKAFHKSNLTDATLVFIGQKKNNYSYKLERYCLKNKIENVLILDNISKKDIKRAYFSADIFLYSSNTETQPLVILDAMGAGLPFITTNVGCVNNLKGGIVVKNINEMVEALRKLINNEKLRQLLSIKGRKEAIVRYNWSKINLQYEELIEKLSK